MQKSLQTIAWVIKLLFTAFPIAVAAYIGVLIGTSVIPFFENFYFSKIVDDLINLSHTPQSPWITTLIIITLLRVFRIIARNFQKYLSRTLNFRMETYLKKIFTFKIASLDYQHLENKDTANLIAKVKEEYQWRFRDTFTQIFDTVIQFASFISVSVILAPRYWHLVVFTVLSEIPGFLVDRNFTKASWKFFNDNAQQNRQTWDLANYLSNKNYLAELNVNQSIQFLKHKFNQILDFFDVGRLELRRNKLPKDIITSFLSLAVITAGTIIIINDIRLGLITVGMFTFYFSTLRQTGDFFSNTIFGFVSIGEHLMYLDNFKKILSLNNFIISGDNTLTLTTPPLIEFRHVYFKYPQSTRFVFKDLNVTILPGEEIALVGVNGAGKSTLIKLLCRFYDPTKGQILINGIDLKTINLESWNNFLSILFQEFTKYPSLTLEDNIRISSHLASSNQDELNDALKKADAFDFTQKYKLGLQTYMSQRYGGEEPSWGQWQKIAISRIFYRNSPVLILDEPTASIDAVSESKIFNNLYKKITGKTIIIVSHRFSTVRNAQRIIVLDQGKIIEEGSHEELIKINGRYAESFKLQAQGYIEDKKEAQIA